MHPTIHSRVTPHAAVQMDLIREISPAESESELEIDAALLH